MSLLSKAIWIFMVLLFLLLLCALFPFPGCIGFLTVLGSGIIVWQTVLILKDEH